MYALDKRLHSERARAGTVKPALGGGLERGVFAMKPSESLLCGVGTTTLQLPHWLVVAAGNGWAIGGRAPKGNQIAQRAGETHGGRLAPHVGKFQKGP